MDEQIREIINFIEGLSLQIEANVDGLIKNINIFEEYKKNFKGDTKTIDDELKNNEIINRVQQKLDDLRDLIF